MGGYPDLFYHFQTANRMFTRFLILFLTCFCTTGLTASPIDDLSSPSQKTRDAAAEILRSSHTAPPGPNWEAIVGTITNGISRTDVEKLLLPFKVTLVQQLGSSWVFGNAFWCRLDDAWVLSLYFEPTNHTLTLKQMKMAEVSVDPPPHFTGVWVVYYVNGQKCQEVHYKDGKRQGNLTVFNSDGSTNYIQRYDHGLPDGAFVAYYVSGRTSASAVYKAGRLVSTVIYNEDGTVKEKRPR
jgi:hypothetical protein